MIFSRLKNPYCNTQNPELCRKVIADVSIKDYETIYRACPFRGTQGFVIGTLIKKLAEAIRTNQISIDYVPDPNSLQSLVTGVTFPPTLGTRSHEIDRRREENLGGGLAGAPPVSSEEPRSSEQTV